MQKQENGAFVRRNDKELLRIEAWGRDSFRVRATQRSTFLTNPDLSALEAEPPVLEKPVEFFQEGTSEFIRFTALRKTEPGRSFFRNTRGQEALRNRAERSSTALWRSSPARLSPMREWTITACMRALKQ